MVWDSNILHNMSQTELREIVEIVAHVMCLNTTKEQKLYRIKELLLNEGVLDESI